MEVNMQAEQGKDCLVCNKHRQFEENAGSLIYQNKLVVISHAILFGSEKDHYLGHTFVETRRHVAGIDELTKEEAQSVGWFISLTARSLKVILGFEHVYTFIFGDHVPHLHVHVIGRYPETPPEFWGNKVDEWPMAPRAGQEGLDQLASKLCSFFKQELGLL
jgi:histidine triad (HIT) family protein